MRGGGGGSESKSPSSSSSFSSANPAAGLEDAAAEEARHTRNHRKKHHSRDETRMPDGWDKHFTEDGTRYYAERASGLSSWEAPEGATGGSTGRPSAGRGGEHGGAEAGATAAATAGGGELGIGVGQVYGAKKEGAAAAAEAAGTIEYTRNPQQRAGSHHQRDSTQLPAGWDKHRDDDGNRYYTDATTGASSWEAPAGARGGSTGQ